MSLSGIDPQIPRSCGQYFVILYKLTYGKVWNGSRGSYIWNDSEAAGRMLTTNCCERTYKARKNAVSEVCQGGEGTEV
jgi:hypothetical protein